MCGIPLITIMEKNLVGKDATCDIKADYNDLDQIKEAIILLSDNEELHRKIGKK
jgi:hypothetical protein